MELPSHPESDESGAHVESPVDKGRSGTVIAVVIGGAFLLLVLLHVTGVVGPAAHR